VHRYLPTSRNASRCASAALAPGAPVLQFGLALALLAVAFSACGAPQGSVPSAVSPAPPAPSPSPTVPLVVSSQPVSFTTADGVTLAGTLYGNGRQAVILSNEGDNASAPWRPVAQELATQGYLVLSYAYRPSDAAFDGLAAHALTDLRAAIAFMRNHTITRLILIGASLGALVSLKAATTLPCDGLVAISAPTGYQDVQLRDADLLRLVMPKLFVTSADNQPFAADTLHLFAAAPQPKVKLVYPGAAHGSSLFVGPRGDDLLSALLRFVQRAAPIW
jgi:pimeloyl-ACP methyl ester carboxylesterase